MLSGHPRAHRAPTPSPTLSRTALVSAAGSSRRITPSPSRRAPCALACSHSKPPPGTRHHQEGAPARAPSGDAAKPGRGGCGVATAFGPVGMGIPCGCGASGPSPVMPAPGAHTPSLQLCYRVPQAQLSLAHAGESRGEDMTQPREDGPHGPHPLVGCKPLLGEGRGRREEHHPAACFGEMVR